MSKCPYCARPLRGLRCRACRRYVLRRVHVALLILMSIAAVIALLVLFEQLG